MVTVEHYGIIARYTLSEHANNTPRTVFIVEKDPLQILIHIRQYNNEGKVKTTLTLPLQRWVNMLTLCHEVEDAMRRVRKNESDVKETIGASGLLQLVVQSPYWNVYMGYQYRSKEDGLLKPGRFGVSLKFFEWTKIIKQGSLIVQKHCAEVLEMGPCWLKDDHNKQDAVITCSECNPH